jgi:hypothetical protein
MAENMRDTSELIDELLDYRRITSDSGMHSYGAAAGAHDDLVLALSVALWTAENKPAVRRRGAPLSEEMRERRDVQETSWVSQPCDQTSNGGVRSFERRCSCPY